MGKVSQESRLGTIKDPLEFIRQASTVLSEIVLNVNGNVTFQDNISCQIVTADFTQADTDLAVKHGLNKTSVNYYPVNKNVACDIYTGSAAATADVIYLKSTVVSKVTLVLF